MRTAALPLLAAIAALGACSTPCGTPSRLSPRAAEAVDPRVPVVNPVRSGPVSPALAAHLAALVDQAQSGDAVFREAAVRAERLAASAGAPKSESWVAAQQALSGAQAARGPTTRALGDIDGLGSMELATHGGISAADMTAVRTASARVAEIDRSQAERIDAIQARLGT